MHVDYVICKVILFTYMCIYVNNNFLRILFIGDTCLNGHAISKFMLDASGDILINDQTVINTVTPSFEILCLLT